MASVVSEFITKTLCDNQGCLNFRSLDEKIKQKYTVSEEVLRSLLFDKDKIAIKEVKQTVTGSQILSPDSLIVAKTGLRLCQEKPGECSQCDGLHLCRYYVCGGCTYGPKCKKNHSLTFENNAELLKKHGLQDLTDEQLFQLLLQNDPSLLPEICPFYNKGNGLHGSCKKTTSCNKLHACQHFFQDNCKFGSSCKRVHNVSECDMKILRGFSQENITNLNEIYKNKFIIIMAQQEKQAAADAEVKGPLQKPSQSNPGSSGCLSKPVSDADKNEICLFFLRGDCRYKEKCARDHWNLPYRWQVLGSDGVTWKDLPDMEDIEKAYCDPGRDTSCVDQPTHTLGTFRFLSLRGTSPKEPPVDFTTMTQGGSPVRRLSTVSTALRPPHFILTTQWLWYWKVDDVEWREFGQGVADTSASVTSQTLENVFLEDSDTEIPFDADGQKYILNFKGEPGDHQMYQQNVQYKTKREVRRRPHFVSAQDVEKELKSESAQCSSTAESVPPVWDKNALPNFGYKLVPLTDGEDYNMIEMLFMRTMPKSKIHKIRRIQNPSLWRVFQWQKEQMKGRNGGKPVNQLYLFHGTRQSLIDAICDQNFDWRMCGVNGTLYGKGSYFARDASYSDRYVPYSDKDTPDSDLDENTTVNRQPVKTMFVALVLVGEYTQGNSSYVRPPPKEDSKTHYDSCVDRESDPSIYVVFEKQQIYPEYLITYS
ncbi:protein mono-ADP-ribosyltransferase PARP12-like isoform X2 [Notolabrus celidotus]|uniref:protein mono-ADP-ribosyltransferase PARP12-like isoform X2 n=1 Tax=Notolabrus celidotus TaxID=1203425 RepID=UPI00149015A3|nr:protein mono-ADP-ribosyltransferase PARP12-like isoform X2 [Notolabrus celidotus]